MPPANVSLAQDGTLPDVVIWNNQMPTSIIAHIEPLGRSRYGPVSG